MSLCLIWSLWLSVSPLSIPDMCASPSKRDELRNPISFILKKRNRYAERKPIYLDRDNDMVQFESPVSHYTKISSGFGMRDHPILGRKIHHNGVDFALPVGTAVQAVAKGKVISSGFERTAGKYITLYHAGGWYSRYMHLSAIKVIPGREIEAGETIALSGNSGRSTGAHLHLEIGYRGVPLDPLAFLDVGEDNPFRMLPRNIHQQKKANVKEEAQPRIILVSGEKANTRISVKWNHLRKTVTPGSVVFGKYRVISGRNGRYELVVVI